MVRKGAPRGSLQIQASLIDLPSTRLEHQPRPPNGSSQRSPSRLEPLPFATVARGKPPFSESIRRRGPCRRTKRPAEAPARAAPLGEMRARADAGRRRRVPPAIRARRRPQTRRGRPAAAGTRRPARLRAVHARGALGGSVTDLATASSIASIARVPYLSSRGALGGSVTDLGSADIPSVSAHSTRVAPWFWAEGIGGIASEARSTLVPGRTTTGFATLDG